MIVSRAVTLNLTKASWIRRMFEGGRAPQASAAPTRSSISPWAIRRSSRPGRAGRRAARAREHAPTARHMPNAGHVRVRERWPTAPGRHRAPVHGRSRPLTVAAAPRAEPVLKRSRSRRRGPHGRALFAEYTFYAENHGRQAVVVAQGDLTRTVASSRPHHRADARDSGKSPNNPSGVIYPGRRSSRSRRCSAAARPSCSSATSPTRAVFRNVVRPRCRRWSPRDRRDVLVQSALAIPGERIGYLAFVMRRAAIATRTEAELSGHHPLPGAPARSRKPSTRLVNVQPRRARPLPACAARRPGSRCARQEWPATWTRTSRPIARVDQRGHLGARRCRRRARGRLVAE